VNPVIHTLAGTLAPHGQIIAIIDPPMNRCSTSETRSARAGRSTRAR
jgi:hypothetical protein